MNCAHKIRPQIEQEKLKTLKDANAIFVVRVILERAIQIQKYIYLYFIDSAKTLDKLIKKQLLELLDSFNISEGDLNNLKLITTAKRMHSDRELIH